VASRVVPAGAAHRLTQRAYHGLLLSAGLAVAEMCAGLAPSYAVPALPPGFAVLAVATAVYAGAWVAVRPRRPTAPFGLIGVHRNGPCAVGG